MSRMCDLKTGAKTPAQHSAVGSVCAVRDRNTHTNPL